MTRKLRDPFREILKENEFNAPGFPRWGSRREEEGGRNRK